MEKDPDNFVASTETSTHKTYAFRVADYLIFFVKWSDSKKNCQEVINFIYAPFRAPPLFIHFRPWTTAPNEVDISVRYTSLLVFFLQSKQVLHTWQVRIHDLYRGCWATNLTLHFVKISPQTRIFYLYTSNASCNLIHGKPIFHSPLFRVKCLPVAFSNDYMDPVWPENYWSLSTQI